LLQQREVHYLILVLELVLMIFHPHISKLCGSSLEPLLVLILMPGYLTMLLVSAPIKFLMVLDLLLVECKLLIPQ